MVMGPQVKFFTSLRGAKNRMYAEFQESGVYKHPDTKGRVRELISATFLENRLGKHLRVANRAEVVALGADEVEQCDVVIYDWRVAPMHSQHGYDVLINEAIFAITEVKSALSKNEFFDACDKIARVKSMPKVAFHESALKVNYLGRDYNYFPTVGFIFAFDGPSIETTAKHLEEWRSEHPMELWPNGIVVLSRGHIGWWDPGTGIVSPWVRGPHFLSYRVHDEPDALVAFISYHLQLSSMWTAPPIRWEYYMHGINIGEPLYPAGYVDSHECDHYCVNCHIGGRMSFEEQRQRGAKREYGSMDD